VLDQEIGWYILLKQGWPCFQKTLEKHKHLQEGLNKWMHNKFRINLINIEERKKICIESWSKLLAFNFWRWKLSPNNFMLLGSNFWHWKLNPNSYMFLRSNFGKIFSRFIKYCPQTLKTNLIWEIYERLKFWNNKSPSFRTSTWSPGEKLHLNVFLTERHIVYYREGSGASSQRL
jgi:hypothetical protein